MHKASAGSQTNMGLGAQADRRKLRQRRVPSSQLGRVMGFAGLGARLAVGTAVDSFTNMFKYVQIHGLSSAASVCMAFASRACRLQRFVSNPSQRTPMWQTYARVSGGTSFMTSEA